jgi:CHAT domain-containing protein
MGASQFQDLNPLPAVPTETSRIAQLWNGKTFLNQNFTRKNLVQVRQQTPFQIIHLATHAEFNPGQVSDSYIQLWDDKLRLDELPKLGWNQPAVDLLVLSACRTAVGNPEAELGFAGIAVASQVKTALASLWSVSDEGTLALMTSFYDELRSAKVKTEALRQAQLSMLRGHTQIESGRILRSGSTISLPPALGNLSQPNLAHPYFWSGFTLIGSPW